MGSFVRYQPVTVTSNQQAMTRSTGNPFWCRVYKKKARYIWTQAAIGGLYPLRHCGI
jgi:hypothetical protein